MRERLAVRSVRLAALWVLAVGGIKLFVGSPGSLPELVRDNFFGPDLNFRLSITVEFACALLALLHPRWGFVALSALFSVFLAILGLLLAAGEKSCGCFGGALQFPPLAMLAIDGSLFAFMLFTRPWRALAPRPAPRLALAGALLFAAALPWLVVPRAPSAPSGAGAWHQPAVLPRFFTFAPRTWIGASLHESELAVWVDTRAYPGDSTWVLYRIDCEHCRDVLRRLASEFATDPKVYVLVALRSVGDEERRVVDDLPPGEQVDLAQSVVWDLTPEPTPWVVRLEGERVVAAERPE